MSLPPPLIDIPCFNPDGLPKHIELYADAIKLAGGIPRLIPDDGDYNTIPGDGLVIPGGRDLPPSMYNEDTMFPADLENTDRIAFDSKVLSDYLMYNKPVLGICYGMQLINVFSGGTLIQDISSQVPGPIDHSAGMHVVEITPNRFIPDGQYMVRSSHHQGIKAPGMDIRPFAYSPDGMIEAVYSVYYDCLVGVQWHPERTDNGLSSALFSFFVKACLSKKRCS